MALDCRSLIRPPWPGAATRDENRGLRGQARLSLVQQSPLRQGRFSFQDEVPGSSPGRPTTTHHRNSERCRQRAGRARCQLGPRWGRTPIPAGTPSGPSGSAHPGGRLGDDHPPWSPTQPRTPATPRGAATPRCSLHPCPPRSRPRRALPRPDLPGRSSGQARPPRPAPDPAARVRHRPPTDHRDVGSVARVPAFATVDRAVDGPAATGPPPVPVVTVARPPRPGPHRHRLRGRIRTRPDGRGRHQTAGHRTAGQPDPGRRDRMVDTACWTPATDAVACLLAGSTTATTPDRSRAAGRCSGLTSSGRATTRTAQPQVRRGHPRCHGWAWPPPRPLAAGGTPPSSWRLGALLSCVGVGWYEERAMGQRKGEGVRGRAVEGVLMGDWCSVVECICAGGRWCACGAS